LFTCVLKSYGLRGHPCAAAPAAVLVALMVVAPAVVIGVRRPNTNTVCMHGMVTHTAVGKAQRQ
jgi:hypothetical protein